VSCAHRSEETGRSCAGQLVDGFDKCLAHLDPDQLGQALQRLHPGAALDAPGTPIDAELLAKILHAVQDDDGHPTFGQVSFDRAHFSGDANFAGVRFTAKADFGAQFSRDTWFARAQFSRDAWFIGAHFTRDARFGGAQFTGNAVFSLAKFQRANLIHRGQAHGGTGMASQIGSAC
jgi:uncharacterized protein YjbI with pentapeptide repeats